MTVVMTHKEKLADLFARTAQALDATGDERVIVIVAQLRALAVEPTNEVHRVAPSDKRAMLELMKLDDYTLTSKMKQYRAAAAAAHNAQQLDIRNKLLRCLNELECEHERRRSQRSRARGVSRFNVEMPKTNLVKKGAK